MQNFSVPINETAYADLYLLKNSREFNTGKKRPLVLVLPGGGYAFTSEREAEPVALKFNSIGCHAAVLYYTTYDQVPDVPFHALCECLQTIAYLRSHADEYCIDPDLIIVCGFSAGANLALHAAMRWQQPLFDSLTNSTCEQRKVNLCIDCYGFLLFGNPDADPSQMGFGNDRIEHPQSDNMRLFGAEHPTQEQYLALSPLTYFEPEFVPPMFIWHTADDPVVPITDTLELATALAKADLPFELVIYEHGIHGLSLADRTTANMDEGKNPHAARWFEQCADWLSSYMDQSEKPYGDYPKGIPGRKGPGNL